MTPKWIKTGTSAMLGTTHTTRCFPSLSALRKAVRPYAHIGAWKVFRELRWSNRAQRDLPGYTGVILKPEGQL